MLGDGLPRHRQAPGQDGHGGVALAQQGLDDLPARGVGQRGDSELTGQTIEQVNADMERDRFLSPEEAVEYGLADRIIESHQLPRAALGFRGDD